ncbi:MAG: DDE-type integrase/transposase/recombinase [Desulfovibrionales bacterium]|nr:DDE-type integrase/transposase/recombinase [Desulfovibrionales bacterium]
MFSNKKYLLKIVEFARYEGVTVRTVKRKIKSNILSVVKVKGESGYRKNHLENRLHYTLLSNPETQEAFLQDRGLLEPENEKPALEPGEEKSFNGLKDWQKKKLNERDDLLRELFEVRVSIPKRKKTPFYKDFARQHNISFSTLRRWMADHESDGLWGLIPKYNCGKREPILTKEMKEFLTGIYMVPNGPTKIETFRKIKLRCKDQNLPCPSYQTLVAYINSTWPPAQQVLIRDKRRWDREYGPYVLRDADALALNECWIGDAKQLDIFVKFRGKNLRPWLTAVLDWKSRMFVGWVLTPVPDSQAVAQSLCYAIDKYGVPQTLYFDRGKPYKSKRIAGEKNEDKESGKIYITGVCQDLNIRIFYASPYNAREKAIEPNFRFLTYIFRNLPGFCGHNSKVRDSKRLAREIKNKKLLSFEEFSKLFDQAMEGRNTRVHTTTKRSPKSFYDGYVPNIPAQWPAFRDFLLQDVHIKTVKNSGVVIDGMFYRGEQLWELSGERVEARRDFKDITRAVIIHKNKVFGSAFLEEAGHYRSPITLESAQKCQNIRKKARKWRENLIEHKDVLDDPIEAAAKMSKEGSLQPRDIRPADFKVVSLNRKSRLAREVGKAIKEGEKQERQKKTAAGGGDSLISQMLDGLEREREAVEQEEPKYRLYNDNYFDDD